MQGRVRGLTAGVMFHLVAWWCCGWAVAQPADPMAPTEPAPEAAETPAATRREAVQESKLPIYLRDKDGKLVAMPGWTFEEFEQLYQQSQGLAEPGQAPQCALESLAATATLRGQHAELKIELTIQLGDSGPVRVPLRLGQAVLRAPATYDGSGPPLVYFDEKSGGYMAVIRGKPRQQHHLTLTALVPLVKAGDETRLALSAPRATRSSLSVDVPLADASAEVSDGAVLTDCSPSDHGTTHIEAQGLGSNFQLTWRKAAARPASLRPVIEAVGNLSATIDGRSVRTVTTLTVRTNGAPFDRFHVRLPKDAELLPSEQADYSIEPAPPRNSPTPGKAETAAAAGRVVVVQLAQEKTEQVIVLETRQTLDNVRPTDWFPLGGFEVVEAARQWGEIAVSVVGDLYVFWGPQRNVEQVERGPLAVSDEQLVGTFEYHSQPFLLSVRVAPRKTRLSVEPQYVVTVNGDRVGLQATLRYTVRGAKVSSLDVQMPGWTIDDAGPNTGLVATGGVAVDPSGLVSVALSEPMTGELQIMLSAHQDIEPPDASLMLSLPRPQADSVGLAAVAVLAADNVEMIPDAERIAGLTRQQVAPPMALPDRYQQPIFYRAETADAVFAAAVHVHTRSIQVQVASEVSLLAGQPRVQETLAYQVQYERIQELELEVPPTVLSEKGAGSLEVLLDGQPLAVADSPEVAAADAGGPLLKRVVLPEPKIGPIELVVRYPIEVPKLRPETSIVATVPLVMPRQGELTGNTLVVTADVGVGVTHQPGPWKPATAESPTPEPGEALRLATTNRADRVVLAVSLQDRDALGSTIVKRAWVQTWIAPAVRQDRAVFRFVSDQKSVDVVLPGGVEPDGVSLWLDGHEVEAAVGSQGSLSVPLPPGVKDGEHLLEVWYRIRQTAAAGNGIGRASLELARLGRDAWVQRMYWQLILPPNEHVIVGPAGFVPEYRWGWTGTFWGRVPLLGQRELETWVGAPPVDLTPSGASTYLFGSMAAVRQCEFRTASRPLVVLIASGAALVLGLILIYIPASRHPAAMLVLCVLLAASAFLYPGPTLLLLEAASLGVALILLALLLHRSVARRRGGRFLGESASSVFERGSTQTVRPAPMGGPRDSTQPAHAVPSSSHHPPS